MPKTIQLSIPQACHEDWQSMTPVEQGRYCMACKKNVIDFANMSDREILQYVAKTTGGFCGRLHNDQIDRDIISQKEIRMPWLKYFFQFTLPAFLISMKVQGQKAAIVKRDTMQMPLKFNKSEQPVFDSSRTVLKGRVTDESGIPLYGATVMIKGTNRGTVTDTAGNYAIYCNSDEPVTLQISYVGYHMMELPVTLAMNTDVKLTTALTGWVGGIVVVSHKRPKIKKAKRSTLEAVRTILTPDSVKLSPNPVGAGNDINVELKLQQPGEYVVEMSDFSGRCVKQQSIQADAQMFRTSVSTAGLQPGTYVVCIRNRKGKKVCVKKILVQY